MPTLWALWFQGLDQPVILPESPQLIESLRQCIHGWPTRLAKLEPNPALPAPPLSVLEPRGHGLFRAHSRYLDEPLDGLPLATAICAVLADLSQAWSDAKGPHAFGLHCGGVRVGTRTMILAGQRRAGKSTLVARLSAEHGVTVLADDVLPVTADGRAIALGLAPRLRLPLPDGASARFRAHVQRWIGPADDRYGYLLAPSLAPHGLTVAADTFVLLDRCDSGPARLHHLPDHETLRHVLERSISGPDGPDRAFAAARSLASRLRGLRLVYSDVEQAVALLTRAMAEGITPARKRLMILPPPAADGAPPPPAADDATLVGAAARFRAAPGIAVRRVGDAVFLWRPGDARLWHLNPVARAIWALLASPGAAARDVAATLAQAFPEQDPARLLADTRALMSDLRSEAFILPVI